MSQVSYTQEFYYSISHTNGEVTLIRATTDKMRELVTQLIESGHVVVNNGDVVLFASHVVAIRKRTGV